MGQKEPLRTFQILHQVDLMLKRAVSGLFMVKLGSYSQGMYDLVIYGRAVTNVLQKLRSTEPDFEAWYLHFQKEMDEDDMMKFFYRLRSLMLKEGLSPVSAEFGVEPFDLKAIQEKFPKPENATKFVLSSEGTESYYEVKKSDGTIERIPVDAHLKQVIIQRFTDGPRTHLGENIEGETVEQMAERYLNYLRYIVSEAHRRYDRMKI